MKPHGVNSIELETPQEGLAASEAFEFAAGAAQDDSYAEIFTQLSSALLEHAVRFQRDSGKEPGKKYSFVLEGYVGTLAETVIRTAGEVHPDPEVRDRIAALTRSYQENVFNSAMSDTPPPDEPPTYRSPFAE